MFINGVYTAMITPFDKDGNVDLEGFKKNIDHQISAGVDGVLFLGTTAETPTLTQGEKDELVRTGIKKVDNRVKVMVGTGTNSTKTTIDTTLHYQEMGADIALVVTPYYNKPTQEGIFRHFRAVTENTDIPVIVYNIEGRTGKNIETQTLKRISELKNIIGVKEASGNINQMGDVIHQIAMHKEGFSVMSGDDGLTLPLMSLGGNGVISVVSNLLPEMIVDLAGYMNNGNIDKARQMHHRLLPFFKGAFIETNPQPVKYMMNKKGMPAGPCRLPLCENCEDTDRLLDSLLEKL